ncbi:MAG: hypothetical protein ACP5U0_10465 [Caldisphaera sp.]
MKLTPSYENTLKYELKDWHKEYLPIQNPKVVVDIGAGEGESVQFFLNHGAEFVIAIEGNDKAFEILKENFKDNPKVLCLKSMVDIIKIDCEGCEKGLVFEAHNLKPILIKHNEHNGLPVDIYKLETCVSTDYDFNKEWQNKDDIK